jgi:hypothetical protein
MAEDGYLPGMDVLSILGAAVCMVGMCGLMMWLMMRGHHSRRSGDAQRPDRPGHI